MQQSKKIWFGIVGLILVIGGFILYWITRKKAITVADDYQTNPSVLAEIQARNLSIYKQKPTSVKLSGITYLNGSSDNLDVFDASFFPMTLRQEKRKTQKRGNKIEEIPTAFDSLKRVENRGKIGSLIAKYDAIVARASETHKVPRLFIYGTMSVENINGSPNAVSTAAAYGVMQIKHTTAIDTVKSAVNLKVLTPNQIAYFKSNKKYGFSSGGDIKISSRDLFDSEININLSCVELSILINKFGLDDPHKVMISYNQGRGRLANDGTTRLTIDAMIDYYKEGAKKEGANYLMRTLGKDGSFDILYNDLKVQN